MTWKKVTTRCGLDDLAPKAKADVSDIVTKFNAGQANASTKKRVAQPWIYIRDNGTFPRALVTMQRADGISLIDGSHRMAAFVLFQSLSDADSAKINLKRPSVNQAVWRGEHSNGERSDY